jgi:hypothetical protein
MNPARRVIIEWTGESMRGPRPPLPPKVKIVAGLLILGGLFALISLLRGKMEGDGLFVQIYLGLGCICGIGILRNGLLARNWALTLLWIPVVLLAIPVVVTPIAWVFASFHESPISVAKLVSYGVNLAVELFGIWMLRVLLDRKLDPLFDRRKWAALDRSHVFE